MSRLSLGSSAPFSRTGPSASLASTSSLSGQRLAVTSQQRCAATRSPLLVEAKQNAKQRIRLSEKARVYNKAHKSAISTRMKKVFKAVEGLSVELPKAEDELKPLEKLISEAYQEIDKAVVKGVLHKNTGARRKSRLAVAKRKLLTEAGLYSAA
ncbi:hypothetical protein WJX72_010566 [[Myrmecia] bisecta]|uniref:30S ribosomal protein S20, chloroplastic n=1 Tax=[Myrmecia] bisecta TaxID=41462 RepID=A0AAW1QG72_9CHLO